TDDDRRRRNLSCGPHRSEIARVDPPPASSTLRIEVIDDSLSNGEVLGQESPSHQNSRERMNGDRGWQLDASSSRHCRRASAEQKRQEDYTETGGFRYSSQ